MFRFVQEKEGLGFPEAVEALADRYGVEVERESEDPRAEEARKRRARLGELLERTAQFYAAYLWESKEAAKAREYLESRGLGEEVLRAFGVGYGPSAWDQVLTRGQSAGFGVPELQAAGLVQKGQKGGHYDRFRARIMFPVRDPRGRVEGFGARALRPDTKPKYLNSPEGELYRKSRTLYGIDRARSAIAKAERAVVVEGYTDVLAAHQAGIEEAVAVMGTAITPEQLKQLARYAEEVVLAMDADRAGRAAMLRAQRVAGSKKLRLRVASMPAGEDPADMLQAGGAERLKGLIQDAMELPEFHVRVALDEADLVVAGGAGPGARRGGAGAGGDGGVDQPGRAGAGGRRPAGCGSGAGDEACCRGWGGSDAALRWPRPGPAGRDGGEQAARPTPPRPLSARERRERALLAMCVASPAEGREFLERLTPEHLSSPAVARARDWLAAHLEDPLAGLPRDDEELVSLVTQIVMERGARAGRPRRDGAQLPAAGAGRHRMPDRGGAEERGRPTCRAPAPPRRPRRADRALGHRSRP